MKTISDNKTEELFNSEQAKIISEENFRVTGYPAIYPNSNFIIDKLKRKNKLR